VLAGLWEQNCFRVGPYNLERRRPLACPVNEMCELISRIEVVAAGNTAEAVAAENFKCNDGWIQGSVRVEGGCIVKSPRREDREEQTSSPRRDLLHHWKDVKGFHKWPLCKPSAWLMV
jgi:hypothetical protein